MSNIIPITFKNQRIILTKVLADQFGTEEVRISQNYLRNKERFTEEKHFYKLTGEQLKEFKAAYLNDSSLKYASELILWTDRGAARHAKILDTDEAWEIYERLEETYFNVKEQGIQINQLSPELQMFKQIFDSVAAQQLEQKHLKQEIQSTKEELAAVREVITINPQDNWREETNILLSKVCKKLNNYQLPKEEVYKALQERAKCDLKRRLENMRARLALEGATKTKINNLNFLDVIAEDVKLREIYIAIIKDLAIKHSIAV